MIPTTSVSYTHLINIYYLIAAIYGWFFWMWGHGEKKSLPIIHTPWKCYLPLFLVFIVSFVGIARILIEYTDSNVPVSYTHL